MKRILALIVCLLSAQMMMAQTTELQAKRVRALDSLFINGRWIKSVGTDTSLTGTNRDLPSIEAVRLHIANRMTGIAGLYSTKTQLQDSIAAIRLLIGNGGSLDWTAGFPVYDARYPSITRFLDTSANIWSRVQTTYQVAQANYSTTYSLSNDIRDSLSARYTKAQSDARFLQSFTESDPVWTAAAANYYTKTQADARYLQSFTETDPTVYAWAKAATKPAYAVAEITGLQTALDGKEPVLGFTPVPNTRTINGYALSANISLTKTDVGLGNVPNTDATNPANISQSASYRFVTDTEKSTWNAKQNALGYTPENIANKGQANGYADLDANGKVPASRIDFSQTGQTFVVASQSAMLAVSGANVGAMAIRTDQSRTYVLIATPASTLANWVQLLSPDAPVQSVNGQTGNVNLLTTNIGEGTNLYYTDARARAAISLTTTGSSGAATYSSSTGVLNVPTYTLAGLGGQPQLNGTGFVKASGTTISYDNSTYLTGNQTITLSGDATGSGATSIALTLANSGVTAGTYTKVTVDAKGRVTTGTTLASADLPTYTGTLTSSQVTTALGYTPYNATNPNSYITSSALSSYLPLSGGTLTAALNGTNISANSFITTRQTLTDGATITWNVSNGGNAIVTLGGTGRTLTITNPVVGATYLIQVFQDGTGGRTITTWPTGTLWIGGTAPTLTSTANARDVITFYYDGTNFIGTYGNDYK